jgi:hypothetical protein
MLLSPWKPRNKTALNEVIELQYFGYIIHEYRRAVISEYQQGFCNLRGIYFVKIHFSTGT